MVIFFFFTSYHAGLPALPLPGPDTLVLKPGNTSIYRKNTLSRSISGNISLSLMFSIFTYPFFFLRRAAVEAPSPTKVRVFNSLLCQDFNFLFSATAYAQLSISVMYRSLGQPPGI